MCINNYFELKNAWYILFVLLLLKWSHLPLYPALCCSKRNFYSVSIGSRYISVFLSLFQFFYLFFIYLFIYYILFVKTTQLKKGIHTGKRSPVHRQTNALCPLPGPWNQREILFASKVAEPVITHLVRKRNGKNIFHCR